jgi:hypothetical protein
METPKGRQLPDGIVKFPPNVHSIRIERSDTTGYTRLVAKQNDTVLSFMLDKDDCLYIAGLLTGAPLSVKA